MVRPPALLLLCHDELSIATKSRKVSAGSKSYGPATMEQKQLSDSTWFRKMGRLGTSNFRSARGDDSILQDITRDDSTAPTRSTASSSFSSKDADVELLIPHLVSTKETRKSCLKLYSHIQNDESMNTIHYDHGDIGTGSASLRKVSWDTIQFRTYETILGDNPSVSAGPPISLGWKYNVSSSTIVSIDDYESRRGRRRSKEQFLLPLVARERALMDAGYSRSEINAAVKASLKIKQSRQVNARVGWLHALSRRKSSKTASTGRVD
jgi:hypothetical protein